MPTKVNLKKIILFKAQQDVYHRFSKNIFSEKKGPQTLIFNEFFLGGPFV